MISIVKFIRYFVCRVVVVVIRGNFKKFIKYMWNDFDEVNIKKVF